MNSEEYWSDLDSRLEQLLENGFVKLPSLDEFDLDFLAHEISNEMGSLTFKESGFCHIEFLEKLKVHKYLTPKLFDIAQNKFNYKGEINLDPFDFVIDSQIQRFDLKKILPNKNLLNEIFSNLSLS